MTKEKRYQKDQDIILVQFLTMYTDQNIITDHPLERVFADIYSGEHTIKDFIINFIRLTVEEEVEYEEGWGFKAVIKNLPIFNIVAYNRHPAVNLDITQIDPFTDNHLNNLWSMYDDSEDVNTDGPVFLGSMYEYEFVLNTLSILESAELIEAIKNKRKAMDKLASIEE